MIEQKFKPGDKVRTISGLTDREGQGVIWRRSNQPAKEDIRTFPKIESVGRVRSVFTLRIPNEK